MICFWAGFQVSVESPSLACSQGSCGLLVKEQGAAQASRLCRAGQCENAASISRYREMAWPMKKGGLLSALPLTQCVSILDSMALKTLSCGQPCVCAVCRVRSWLWLCALIPGCLSSLSALLFSFFPPSPSISGFFFVLVTSYGDRDLAVPPKSLPQERHQHVGDSTHVLLPWLELVWPSLSSAQCLDSEFDTGTEQQKQERAQPVAPGESLAGLETQSSSPYPAHVAPQLSHLLPLIHFPRAQSCQLLGAGRGARAERGSPWLLSSPGQSPCWWPPLPAQSHHSAGSLCFGSALVNCAASSSTSCQGLAGPRCFHTS